jgi:hypothetical protein
MWMDDSCEFIMYPRFQRTQYSITYITLSSLSDVIGWRDVETCIFVMGLFEVRRVVHPTYPLYNLVQGKSI